MPMLLLLLLLASSIILSSEAAKFTLDCGLLSPLSSVEPLAEAPQGVFYLASRGTGYLYNKAGNEQPFSRAGIRDIVAVNGELYEVRRRALVFALVARSRSRVWLPRPPTSLPICALPSP